MKYTCPKHGLEMREFTAGPKAKNPGMVYHKCTQRTEGKFCEQVRFPEDPQVTKKFTALPNGQVREESAPWPVSDVRTILQEMNDKLDKILFAVGNHN